VRDALHVGGHFAGFHKEGLFRGACKDEMRLDPILLAQPIQKTHPINGSTGSRHPDNDSHFPDLRGACSAFGTDFRYNADSDPPKSTLYSEDHNMERPGEKLKHIRERLRLTYRDVERATLEIARRRGNPGFAIALSRLADIENKGTLPTIYRLYSLCAFYRLELPEVMRWYGVPPENLINEALQFRHASTHLLDVPRESDIASQPPEDERDLEKTVYLGHIAARWGRVTIAFLNSVEARRHRYGFIGLEDWSMYPLVRPGSLVLIDETRRRVASSGWTHEYDRPIYFLEHRQGYLCAWCSLADGRLLVQPHPASHYPARAYIYPTQIEVIGQVVAVATALESRKRRHVRNASVPAKSPSP
jgi:transcriptional regulator with XRE-family HTH domain